jgi:hypothetical protein
MNYFLSYFGGSSFRQNVLVKYVSIITFLLDPTEPKSFEIYNTRLNKYGYRFIYKLAFHCVRFYKEQLQAAHITSTQQCLCYIFLNELRNDYTIQKLLFLGL